MIINNVNNLNLANAFAENGIKFISMISNSLDEITDVTVEFDKEYDENIINNIITQVSTQ